MIRPLLSLLMIIGGPSLFAQGDTLVLPPPIHLDTLPSNDGGLTRLESPPMFPGGDAGLVAYLTKELRYPDAMRQAGKEGVVQVAFTITDAGDVTKVHLAEGIAGADALNEEALRVVKAMPRWTPATVKGVTVPMEYKLPVRFEVEK